MSEFRYRGRAIGQEDILYIRALIELYPGESRRKLSVRLCEAWQWRQANGALRDMVCRGLLLMLERAGQITLPPVSYVRHNPLSRRARPEPVLIDATPIDGRLCNLQPLQLEQVRRTAQEPLFNSLMEQHHYLGYEQPVGEHLKYVVWSHDRPVACLAWSSAPRHLASRDHYIGWDAAARRSRIRCCSPPSAARTFTGFHRRTRTLTCAARMCCRSTRLLAWRSAMKTVEQSQSHFHLVKR